MQPQNHDARFDGIPEKRLQAFGPSAPKTLQSQTSLRSKNRLLAQWLGKFFTDDSLSARGRGISCPARLPLRSRFPHHGFQHLRKDACDGATTTLMADQ